MARIAGIDLPKQKRGVIGLGVGPTVSKNILDKAEIDHDKKVVDWSDEEVASLRQILEEDYKVEGALRTEVNANIRRLIETGSYRGVRHRKGLPVRGQRTQTNARTRKGKRRAIAGKKAAPKK